LKNWGDKIRARGEKAKEKYWSKFKERLGRRGTTQARHQFIDEEIGGPTKESPFTPTIIKNGHALDDCLQEK